MADNVAVTAGAGTTLATDDIGGVHYPRTKMVIGANNANDGDVSSSNPMPTLLIGGPVKAIDSVAGATDPGVVILGQRRDVDNSPVSANGDYSPLLTDEGGRLKVAGQPASYPLVTGVITTVGDTVFCDVSRASNVMFHMSTSALAGHVVAFEGSIDSTNGVDGTWFAIQAVRTNSNTVELVTPTLAATLTSAYRMSVNGLKFMRLRCTAITSGSATWRIQQAPYATDPIPAAQASPTQAVSGTVTANEGTKLSSTTVVINSAATTNLQALRAAAASLFSMVAYNAGTTVAYLKLYNKTTAPAVATDVPIIIIKIPPDETVQFSFGNPGMRFSSGIASAITGAKTDTDATAVAAAQVKVALAYI